MLDTLDHLLRMKRPCANCPFLKVGAIRLMPGRREGIIQGLLEDDFQTFYCHKTVNNSNEDDWGDYDEDTESSRYKESGNEAMCAGAAAYLMKVGRPTVGMRVAFAMDIAKPEDWDEAQQLVIGEIS